MQISLANLNVSYAIKEMRKHVDEDIRRDKRAREEANKAALASSAGTTTKDGK